jgi:hypothetical protein
MDSGLGESVAKKGMHIRFAANGKRNGKREGVPRDPEHARFIFTPLIGPCVAIAMRNLMTP